jgi:hypothetical protein
LRIEIISYAYSHSIVNLRDFMGFTGLFKTLLDGALLSSNLVHTVSFTVNRKLKAIICTD